MAITVTCPGCGKKLSVHDDLRGERIRCKGCQESFRAGSPRNDVVVEDNLRPAPRRRRKDADEPKSSPTVLIVVGVAAFSVTLLLAGLAYWLFGTGGSTANPPPNLAQNTPRDNNPPPQNPVSNPPQNPPVQPPPPVVPTRKPDPKLQGAWDTVYLTDMDEYDVLKGPWGLGKHGNTGDPNTINSAIVVDGIRSEKGLGAHPPGRGYFRVRYALGKKAAEFRGAVAFNDINNLPQPSPTTFSVYGDGKLLWESPVLEARRVVRPFRINVSGVEELELRVQAASPAIHAHAVWVEPHLVKDASTPFPLQ